MRGDDGSGWSIVWRMIMWARLRDAEHAKRIIGMFLRPVDANAETNLLGGGVYDSGLCAHPPFQIDGNLGFPAALSEMLVQSHDGWIRILPALPEDWHEEPSMRSAQEAESKWMRHGRIRQWNIRCAVRSPRRLR